ncbi:MAG: DUF2784 domain-containing protein [Massilia sp.]
MPYQFMADAVLILHVGIVLFIVLGQALIVAGALLGWRWIRHLPFRALHLAAILYVALQTWFGLVCPLTTLEQWLRVQAGEGTYTGDFIGHWLAHLLFYQAPPWVFIAGYSVFASLVAASWWWAPPRGLQRGDDTNKRPVD